MIKKLWYYLFKSNDIGKHTIAMIICLALIIPPVSAIAFRNKLNATEAEFDAYKANYEVIAAVDLVQSAKLVELQLEITDLKKNVALLSQRVDGNKTELQNQKIDNDQMSQQSLEFIFTEIWDAIEKLEKAVY